MQIAQALAGFTAGEADILRRAMGKKKKAELDRQKERFVNGAIKAALWSKEKEPEPGLYDMLDVLNLR